MGSLGDVILKATPHQGALEKIVEKYLALKQFIPPKMILLAFKYGASVFTMDETFPLTEKARASSVLKK